MTILPKFIPCGANANCAIFANYLLKFAELVKFALKTGRGCHSIYCTYCLPFLSCLVVMLAGCAQQDEFESDQVGNFEALWTIMDEH